jgi:hypothetical protein
MTKISIALGVCLGFQIALAAEVGQSADAALATYTSGQATQLDGKIPDVLNCGNDTFLIKNSLEDKGGYDGVWLSQDGLSVALIVPEDGEQEHGYFVRTADLLSLKSGSLSQVTADTFSGYWWSDGDHGTYGEPVQCTVGQ